MLKKIMVSLVVFSVLLIGVFYAKHILPAPIYAKVYNVLPFQGGAQLQTQPAIYKQADGTFSNDPSKGHSYTINPNAMSTFKAPETDAQSKKQHSKNPIDAMRQQNEEAAAKIQAAKDRQMERAIYQ